MIKNSKNFNFFLDHLYKDVGEQYHIDGDQTRNLVKYIMQFHKNDEKKSLRHLKQYGTKKDIDAIMAEIANKEQSTKIQRDSIAPHSTFSLPEGIPLSVNINYSKLNRGKYMKTAGPAFTVPVSDSEKAQAIKVREGFEDVLSAQEKFFSFAAILFGHLEELEDQTGLMKISPLLKQYEHKMKKIFNKYIKEFSKALALYEENFSDTEMDEIRDLIIENVKGMRNIVIDLIVLMKDIGDDNFVQEALEKYRALENLNEKLSAIIENEWFSHIDYDVLGKIRLGHEIPLFIKKRS